MIGSKMLAHWSCDEKPDSIIVFPDTSVQGVVEAIWKLGLDVPSQLRLCLHRNQGIDIVCPFPAHWAETSLSSIAEVFFKVLLAKNNGEPCPLPVTLPFTIVA
ncbi:MAG: hypothetical protein ACOYM3_25065 [Terrimicrobiaceae bacterium]